MNASVVAFTAAGAALGRRLIDALLPGAELRVPERLAESVGETAYESLEKWTEEAWKSSDALIFVGAAGIAVRSVAPYLEDKFTDPCVVSVDEAGRFAVPLLSGHVGGGNALACRIAELTGGQAVITTATDVNELFAVDVWAAQHDMVITDRLLARKISAALLEGKPVAFHSNFGHKRPEGLVEDADLGIWVTCHRGAGPFAQTLRLVPRCLTLGIGCRRGIGAETIRRAVKETMTDYDPAAIYQVATIDRKANEPGLLEFCRTEGLPLRVFTPEELKETEGTFTSSLYVESITGVDNVCERAAVRAGGPWLEVPKRVGDGVTVAVARRRT